MDEAIVFPFPDKNSPMTNRTARESSKLTQADELTCYKKFKLVAYAILLAYCLIISCIRLPKYLLNGASDKVAIKDITELIDKRNGFVNQSQIISPKNILIHVPTENFTDKLDSSSTQTAEGGGNHALISPISSDLFPAVDIKYTYNSHNNQAPTTTYSLTQQKTTYHSKSSSKTNKTKHNPEAKKGFQKLSSRTAYISTATSGQFMGGILLFENRTDKNNSKWEYFLDNAKDNPRNIFIIEKEVMRKAIKLWDDILDGHQVILKTQFKSLTNLNSRKVSDILGYSSSGLRKIMYSITYSNRKTDKIMYLAHCLARLYKNFDFFFGEFQATAEKIVGFENWGKVKNSMWEKVEKIKNRQ